MPVITALRDALYRRWRACLGDPSLPFEAAAHPAKAAHAAYLADRVPRYRAVLDASRKAAGGPFEVAQLLLDHGLYFDAHEFLESFWREASEPERTRLQGIIQLAAAFHKLELDPAAQAGCLYLLEAGLKKLRDAGLERELAPARAALREGRFRLEDAPRLKVTPA